MADVQENIDKADTTSLEPPKPQSFKVKLKATKSGDQTICGFTYIDGDGFGHWSLENQGLEVEFTDLEIARAFMTAAAATGGLEIAAGSPTKLK